MVLQDITLVPVYQGSKAELQACLKLAAESGLKPRYEKRGFESINQGYEDMVNDKVVGRYVYSWR
jgi:D-arabinose 1-dehydrogenase-like Zn-dependent alcohol dehydrogenase